MSVWGLLGAVALGWAIEGARMLILVAIVAVCLVGAGLSSGEGRRRWKAGAKVTGGLCAVLLVVLVVGGLLAQR